MSISEPFKKQKIVLVVAIRL